MLRDVEVFMCRTWGILQAPMIILPIPASDWMHVDPAIKGKKGNSVDHAIRFRVKCRLMQGHEWEGCMEMHGAYLARSMGMRALHS